MKFAVSSLCSAFQTVTVGTKVTDPNAFVRLLGLVLEDQSQELEAHDTNPTKVPGQYFLPLGKAALDTVSAGVGLRTGNPHDYVVRTHRGRVSAFLKRNHALPAESLSVVVYTLDAYANDPEVDSTELATAPFDGATHVIVAVLASAGPPAPLTPYRFVSNLAGGNREALLWTGDTIRAKAREILDYDETYCVVAD